MKAVEKSAGHSDKKNKKTSVAVIPEYFSKKDIELFQGAAHDRIQ